VIVNNDATASASAALQPPGLTDAHMTQITIPVVMIGHSDGTQIFMNSSSLGGTGSDAIVGMSIEYSIETTDHALASSVSQVLQATTTTTAAATTAAGADTPRSKSSLNNTLPTESSIEVDSSVTFSLNRLTEWQGLHAQMISGEKPFRAVVWTCSASGDPPRCGGHGDRLKGIVSAFYLAVLTNRAFLIDYSRPHQLEQVMLPKLIDWRLSTLPQALRFQVEHTPVMNLIQQDLLTIEDWARQKAPPTATTAAAAAADPFPVLRIAANLWHVPSLFSYPNVQHLRFDKLSRSVGLKDYAQGVRVPAFQFDAELFGFTSLQSPMRFATDVLFAPTEFMRKTLADAAVEFKKHQQSTQTDAQTLPSDEPPVTICIHVRSGGAMGGTNPNLDPIRHANFVPFWECAESMEREYGLDTTTTNWLLATDGPQAGDALTAYLLEKNYTAGKKAILTSSIVLPSPSSSETTALKFGHMDKSPLTETLSMAPAFADHQILTECNLLVASESGFSFTAAAMHRRYEAKGGEEDADRGRFTFFARPTAPPQQTTTKVQDFRFVPHGFWELEQPVDSEGGHIIEDDKCLPFLPYM
jgi:hypothetical protein